MIFPGSTAVFLERVEPDGMSREQAGNEYGPAMAVSFGCVVDMYSLAETFAFSIKNDGFLFVILIDVLELAQF